MTRRALVSGAAGFIGRHFVRALIQGGWEVHAFDRIPFDGPSVMAIGPADTHVWQADARDWFRGTHCEVGEYDLVIHAAAVVGGRRMIEGDPLAIATNLGIDAEMFRWALRTRPGQVVYFSSSAVYPVAMQREGVAIQLPESLVSARGRRLMLPDETYGWCKLTGEILADKARAQGLDIRVFRPFSGYGEDQALDYPFPSFIDRAARRADPFDVWGDGRQVRDWIHVDDVVDAVLAHLEADVAGPVNLGSGTGVSFRQLAATVIEAVDGYAPEIRYLPAEPAGVAYRVADPAKMLATYTPRVGLVEGIRRALAATVRG